MAFTVAPTSGDSPYILSADIINSGEIDGVEYEASVRSSLGTGSCPAFGSSTPLSSALVNELLTTGSVETGLSSVPVGNCRAFTIRISRVSDGVLVSTASTFVDNV